MIHISGLLSSLGIISFPSMVQSSVSVYYCFSSLCSMFTDQCIAKIANYRFTLSIAMEITKKTRCYSET